MAVRDDFDRVAFDDLLADASDAVLVVEADDTVSYANAAVADVFGYQPGELVGRSFIMLVAEPDRADHAVVRAGYQRRPQRRKMGGGRVLRALHRDGRLIDVEIGLVPVRGSVGTVAAFVRDVSETQRLIRRLAATNELLAAALGGVELGVVELRAAELGRAVTRADAVWLVTIGDAGAPTLAGASGETAEFGWVGRVLADPARWVAPGDGCRQLVRHEVDLVADIATGCAAASVLVVPFGSIGPTGYLLVGRRDGRPEFLALDQEVAVEFGRAAAITLGLAVARAEMEELHSIADRERIARDLHDVVIQRLYAIAMGLESATGAAAGPAAAQMVEAVEQLDEVIRSIRTTIFNLRQPPTSRGGLKSAVAAEVDAAAALLGFAPALRFRGLVDTIVPEQVAAEAVVVVRELLSNVVRHSHANQSDVAVAAEHGRLRVTVSDDGIGMRPGTAPGDGLTNLTDRAGLLGGTFMLKASPSGGVVATWEVPV